jgi:hypothetical protein
LGARGETIDGIAGEASDREEKTLQLMRELTTKRANKWRSEMGTGEGQLAVTCRTEV